MARPSRTKTGAAKHPVLLSLLGATVGLAAIGYVGYVLWPRWPDPPADAPSVPITVSGVSFNVPPAAIRVPVQRRPGAQTRLDLAFLWPTLTPPGTDRPASSEDIRLIDRVFVSISAADGALSLEERIKTIYPRYVEANAFNGPEGLIGVAFREDTPYRGEDLFFVADRSENFVVRCTRDNKTTRGTCLHERRLGEAAITARFPREWLNDWRKVAEGVNRLIETLRAGQA